MKKEYLYIGGIIIGLGAIAFFILNIKKENQDGNSNEAKDIANLLKKIDEAKK
jgi:hypothetical protein